MHLLNLQEDVQVLLLFLHFYTLNTFWDNSQKQKNTGKILPMSIFNT